MRSRIHFRFTLAALAMLVWAQSTLAALPSETEKSVNRALQLAEYGRIALLLEGALPDLSKAAVSETRLLCYAYHQIKSYRRLFACLDRWDAMPDADEPRSKGESVTIALPTRVRAMSRDTLRAEALIELADYRQAIESATRAYKRRERDTNSMTYGYQQRLLALPTLAIAHALNGELAEARRYAEMFDPAWHLRISPAVGPEIHIDLARIYAAQRDFAKALEHAKAADYSGSRAALNVLAVFLSFKGGQPVPLQSEAVYTSLPRNYLLNKCLYETGDVAAAKQGYDMLLTWPAIKDNGEIHWMVLYDRGQIAEREGKPDEAAGFYRRAIEIIERNRSSINTEASKIGYVGNRQSVYGRLVPLLVAAGDFPLAFQYVERARSRALVDMLSRTENFALPQENADRVRAMLAQAARAEDDARLQDTSRVQVAMRGDGSEVRAQIAAHSEELASLTSVRAATLAEIRARLAPDETLVEYFIADEYAYAFVLRGEKITAVRLAADKLEAEVARFRRAVGEPALAPYEEIARRLHDRLFAPLREHIDTPNLVIVPHGPLHYVAFAALFDGRQHLVERHGIRMLPSASVLKYISAGAAPKPGALLAFGNPDLGDARYQLAQAREEAIRIAGLQPESLALVDDKATETALKTLGRGFRYLHIASHGEFVPDAPLQSALRLAPDAQNDGLMTVGELFSLRLDVDIVTLSACETGLGTISRGDDVVGLTRAFLYAGSRSVIASLWKVEDNATANLMTAFYAGLTRADRREALRRAQMDTRAKYPHPFFWAAFQLTGSAN